MILITGFTGNTGSIVLGKLLENNEHSKIIGISRDNGYANKYGMNIENIALENSKDLKSIFDKYPITKIIHIANIRYSPIIMELADQYNIDKVVLVHTTGVYSKYRNYSSLYKEIEQKILNNSYKNTNYVILRPTMIYGNERDHNMHKLIKFLNKFSLFPVFGDGSALMQPVHVEDLADAIYLAHNQPDINNEGFDLSGGSVVEYKKVLSLIANGLNKKVLFLYIPMKLAILCAKIYNRLFKRTIITVEQVERLQEDKAYPNDKARKLLGWTPRKFEEGIRQEIELLKAKKVIK